jgi:carbonic anhydrase
MRKLIDGLHHFQSEVFLSHKELFERLAHEQSPDALFITCSDSRVNPNLLTQSDPGDIFVLRNAGNIVPPHGAGGNGEAATIEFAVAKLAVKDIIICGHSQCGAMTALLHPAALANMPATASWLQHAEATRRIISENYTDLSEAMQLTVCTQENVLVQLENLRTHPVIASGLARKSINLHGWVYDIGKGRVFAYKPETGQFSPVMKVAQPERKRTERGLLNSSI